MPAGMHNSASLKLQLPAFACHKDAAVPSNHKQALVRSIQGPQLQPARQQDIQRCLVRCLGIRLSCRRRSELARWQHLAAGILLAAQAAGAQPGAAACVNTVPLLLLLLLLRTPMQVGAAHSLEGPAAGAAPPGPPLQRQHRLLHAVKLNTMHQLRCFVQRASATTCCWWGGISSCWRRTGCRFAGCCFALLPVQPAAQHCRLHRQLQPLLLLPLSFRHSLCIVQQAAAVHERQPSHGQAAQPQVGAIRQQPH